MEFLILVHCAALRKETSQSEEKVTTSGYCTKIKVNNCLCTYIHLYTVVEASWSRIYCTVNVFAKKKFGIINTVFPHMRKYCIGNTKFFWSCKAIPRIISAILTILCIRNVVFSNKTRIWRLCKMIVPACLIWGIAVGF